VSDEDPRDDVPMTIGEHLEELRRHVLRAVLWILLALGVCLAFQDKLMEWAKWPHSSMVAALKEQALTNQASHDLQRDRVRAAVEAMERDDALEKRLEEAARAHKIAMERARPTTPETLRDLERRQTEALERLADLQRRFEATSPTDVAALEALDRELGAAREAAIALRAEVARDVRPLLDERAQGPEEKLVSLSPPDVFMTYIKLAMVAAIFLAAPLIVWELWKFVSRALYPHERKWVALFGPLTYGAFLSGFMFGYLVLIPIGLRFLGSYAPAEIAMTQYSITGYMSILITLSLVCGVIFELPLVMTFLALIGIVDAAGFRSYRKYWILTAFIVAGILTPPDPFTQTLMAIPLLGLYELGIVLAAFVRKPAGPPAEIVPEAEPVVPIEDRYPETPLPPATPAPASGFVDEDPSAAPPPPATTPTTTPTTAVESTPFGVAPRPAPEGTVAAPAPLPPEGTPTA
jgi:Tat protein translocase TatC